MRISIFLMLLACTIQGCARIPEPIDYQHSVQRKMQAAYHWEILAKDVATRINNELVKREYFDTPLYVKPTCGDEDTPCSQQETSPFNEAFRDLLITDLVNAGIPTKRTPDEKSLIVNYKVQIVRHNATRFRTLQPGLITSLTAAVLVLRNAPEDLLILAGSGLVDYANQNLVANGKHEVIITTSVTQNGTYLYRGSDIYYINDSDYTHYMEIGQPARTITLTAPEPPPVPKKFSSAQAVEQKPTIEEPPVITLRKKSDT